jgi:hypothetical protein
MHINQFSLSIPRENDTSLEPSARRTQDYLKVARFTRSLLSPGRLCARALGVAAEQT